MEAPQLTRLTSCGVTLLSDTARPSGVTLAFTERTGGVSEGPWASLNLGLGYGDDDERVRENRRRLLAAVGAGHLEDRLINPKQVHGSEVVVVTRGDDEALAAARDKAQDGADAIVCTVPDVCVLLCYADCVPVVLVAPGGFAVVHSGWRGTDARICAKAVCLLAKATGTDAGDVRAYVGPHIGKEDYRVSAELCERFEASFGPEVLGTDRKLDLGRAVELTLEQAGVPAAGIVATHVSTAQATDRFFSYRASGGTCGRHGAIACMIGKA